MRFAVKLDPVLLRAAEWYGQAMNARLQEVTRELEMDPDSATWLEAERETKKELAELTAALYSRAVEIS